MYSVRLYTLPEDKPWTLEEFLVRTYKLCVHSAQVRPGGDLLRGAEGKLG